MMLTKEQYEYLKHSCCPLADELFANEIVTFERANPPPPEVKCPACEGAMEFLGGSKFWRCPDSKCLCCGPSDDPDGKKVMALGKRKLPIKPPFVVVGTEARPILRSDMPKDDDVIVAHPICNKRDMCFAELRDLSVRPTEPRMILGDPIDVSEWVNG